MPDHPAQHGYKLFPHHHAPAGIKERETERERQRERETERDRERQRERQTDRDRDRESKRKDTQLKFDQQLEEELSHGIVYRLK